MSRQPFLEVIVHDCGSSPTLRGLCAGFEGGKWRDAQLARWLFEHLPDFALTHREKEQLDHTTAVSMLCQAAQLVYTSPKFKLRGEFGELLLHAVLAECVGTKPAISKLFYKTSPNDTVKGFDAVHVVDSGPDLELWLGEVKFYTEIGGAITAVVEELRVHLAHDYLRTEFLAVTNHIDPAWPHASRLKDLLDGRTSLDKIFDRLCVPVLLTYDSATVLGSTKGTAAYRSAFEAEVRAHHKALTAKLPGLLPARIHLFLLPLRSKADLVALLDSKLKALQAI